MQVLIVLLAATGIFLFCRGFLPSKTLLSVQDHADIPSSINGSDIRNAPIYDNLVFMVVDALRADFIDSAKMPFATKFVIL